MAHPFYHKCLGMVNRPVTVHLVSGARHYGMIQRVTPTGIYFMRMNAPRVVNSQDNDLQITTTENKKAVSPEAETVFWAPFFLAFGLLAGLTLGYAAGAYGGYGYGGYGYGYGYGPYGGYGYGYAW